MLLFGHGRITKDMSGLGLEELKALLVQALEENARLKAENAELREEIARLKGLKGRPKLRPSGMEKGTEAFPAKGSGRKGRRGAKRTKLTIDETRIVKPEAAVPGGRFKGYEDFIVQDMVIKPWTVLYRRERWLSPSGKTVVAALPKGAASHFGPGLKRFILSQYHQGQVTIPRLLAQLQDLAIDISKRQIVRLLSGKQDAFLAEASEVLRAGLASASWITVDDTGARHKAKNGFCTHIGNDRFAWFGTRSSKTRLNFLELLRAGRDDYVISQAALDYMRDHGLPQTTIALLASAGNRFAGREAFMAHLEKLGLTGLKVHPDPVQIASEGAAWGPNYPDIKVEITIDYGLTDIVAERYDAGVRLGEEVATAHPPAAGALRNQCDGPLSRLNDAFRRLSSSSHQANWLLDHLGVGGVSGNRLPN